MGEEPTTTVITTTEEPTTTVITTTDKTTTEASVCTIDDFEADDNGNCFKVVTTKLNWAKEGTWAWKNGDDWSYTKWKDSDDIKNKDEDYAFIASSNGKWQDEDCSKKLHYVCMEK